MAQSLLRKSLTISSNKITSRPKSQTTFRNFSNPNMHSAIDIARIYSGQVDAHFHITKFENHSLNTAYNDYRKQGITLGTSSRAIALSKSKMKRTASSTGRDLKSERNVRSAIRPIRIENNKVVRNPQDLAQNASVGSQNYKSSTMEESNEKGWVKQALNKKTQIISEYSQQLQIFWAEKARIEQQIKMLKSLINSEKKQKAKLSLACNKIMNENELVYKSTCIKQEDNYRLRIQVQQVQKQNSILSSQIEQLSISLEKVRINRQQKRSQCKNLKHFIDETRLILLQEEKQISKLKGKVTQFFNNMSNSYMNIDLLKSQKALLMVDVRNQTKNL